MGWRGRARTVPWATAKQLATRAKRGRKETAPKQCYNKWADFLRIGKGKKTMLYLLSFFFLNNEWQTGDLFSVATLGRETIYVKLKKPAKVWSPAPHCLSSKCPLQSHLTGCKTFSGRQVLFLANRVLFWLSPELWPFLFPAGESRSFDWHPAYCGTKVELLILPSLPPGCLDYRLHHFAICLCGARHIIQCSMCARQAFYQWIHKHNLLI